MDSRLPTVRCADVIDVRDGTHDTPNSVPIGIPLITSKNLRGGKIDFSDISFISKQDHLQIGARSKVDEGDILFAMIGTIGNPVIVKENTDFSIKNVALFKFAGSKVSNSYFRHLLESDVIRSQLDRESRGGTQKFISLSALRNLKFPLPPLPEQQRIAAILDQAEALQAKRRQALAKLDTLTQSLFLEMFGDPRTNTREWPVRRLSEVGTLERGRSKHRPRNAPELLNGPYPLIQTGEIANSRGRVSSFRNTYSERGLKQSRLWPEGTLCITIAANIAETARLDISACFPDSVVGFVPHDFMTTEFVQGWFGFLQKVLEEQAPQVAQKNINLDILRNLTIITPPKCLQESFSTVVEQFYGTLDNMLSCEKRLNVFVAALQHRTFRGEL